MSTARIAELNDRARTTLKDCRLVITQGVAKLDDLDAIIARVQAYDAFTPNNDPYQEHDFGSFEYGKDRELIFWKIDYYDSDRLGASPDASDPAVTNRVLTILLASEY